MELFGIKGKILFAISSGQAFIRLDQLEESFINDFPGFHIVSSFSASLEIIFFEGHRV